MPDKFDSYADEFDRPIIDARAKEAESKEKKSAGRRKAMSIFDRVKQRLSKRPARIDWTDEDERRAYKRETAREKREAQINAVLPSHRCPICDEVKPNSRQLVIVNRSKLLPSELFVIGDAQIICRSCAKRYLW